MQTITPAENLLQRLLQSERIRNHYSWLIEDKENFSDISLRCFAKSTERNASNMQEGVSCLFDKKN